MQRTRSRTATAIVGAILVAAVAVGSVSLAGSNSSKKHNAAAPRAAASGGLVNGWLNDFKIAPSTASVSAGKVTFVATNVGKTIHELVVLRTDKSAGALLHGKRASEAGHVGEIGDFGAGHTRRLTLNLKPGHYSLICNLPGHYMAGMHIDFTVR
jgi:uncharacterized cupredoxin-like copper-binding protein